MCEVDDFAPEFHKVFSLIDALQALYSNSELDLNNIEALFAILEMVSTLNRLYTSGARRVTDTPTFGSGMKLNLACFLHSLKSINHWLFLAP